MHLNHYFLRVLSDRLTWLLGGKLLGECFSQHKDELVLGFFDSDDSEKQFYIIVNTDPMLTGFSFSEQYDRAKRNSADLFEETIEKRIVGVSAVSQDRSLYIDFSEGYRMLFKMHGPASNIILFKNGNAIELFRKKFTSDLTVSAEALAKRSGNPEEVLKASEGSLHKLYPSFDKHIRAHLIRQGFETADFERKLQILKETLQLLEQPRFFVGELKEGVFLSFFREDFEYASEYTDAVEAATQFSRLKSRILLLQREKEQVRRILSSKIKKYEQSVKNMEKRLSELQDIRPSETADLLMANLHAIPHSAEEVTLFDFYVGKERTIKLKKELSPQKNAETLYRKSKNQQKEHTVLTETLERNRLKIQQIQESISKILLIKNYRELLPFVKKYLPETKGGSKKVAEVFPFKRFDFEGYQIWVGKNAKNNDLLTLKYAHKDDLWLHAKDVSGSHVVVKHQAGKPIPKNVKEYAASLAAKYSERKHDRLCPVSMTLKKYVRKPKGSPPGAVVVEREEMLLVPPHI